MQQTFFAKYKVFIIGLASAVFMALIPVLQPNATEAVTIASIVMAVVTAAGSWLANNLRGKAQSIAGIIFSALTLTLPVLFAHGQVNWQNLLYLILTQVGAQFFGYSAAPFKPSTYEHNEAIVEAKKLPPVDQVALPADESKIIKPGGT